MIPNLQQHFDNFPTSHKYSQFRKAQNAINEISLLFRNIFSHFIYSIQIVQIFRETINSNKVITGVRLILGARIEGAKEKGGCAQW